MPFKKGSPEAKAYMAKLRNAKRQTGASDKSIDKTKQALKVGKRVSKNDNVYYERRANRSDKGKLLGVGSTQKTNQEIINDFTMTSKRIENFEKNLFELKYKLNSLKLIKGTTIERKKFFVDIKFIQKYLIELKQHKTELKKLM